MLLKDHPEFLKLKSIKKYAAALARYSKYTIDEFINEYNNKGLKGKEVYDSLMKVISQNLINDDSQETVGMDNKDSTSFYVLS